MDILFGSLGFLRFLCYVFGWGLNGFLVLIIWVIRMYFGNDAGDLDF